LIGLAKGMQSNLPILAITVSYSVLYGIKILFSKKMFVYMTSDEYNAIINWMDFFFGAIMIPIVALIASYDLQFELQSTLLMFFGSFLLPMGQSLMYYAVKKGVLGVVSSIMRFQVVILLVANVVIDGIIPANLALYGIALSTIGMIIISIGKTLTEYLIKKCSKDSNKTDEAEAYHEIPDSTNDTTIKSEVKNV
jgi:drug/metabolite transporter (DMT)-like permease